MKKWFINLEFVLLFLVIVAMLLKQLNINGGDFLLMVSLLSLSMLYFVFALMAPIPVHEKASPFLKLTLNGVELKSDKELSEVLKDYDLKSIQKIKVDLF